MIGNEVKFVEQKPMVFKLIGNVHPLFEGWSEGVADLDLSELFLGEPAMDELDGEGQVGVEVRVGGLDDGVWFAARGLWEGLENR